MFHAAHAATYVPSPTPIPLPRFAPKHRALHCTQPSTSRGLLIVYFGTGPSMEAWITQPRTARRQEQPVQQACLCLDVASSPGFSGAAPEAVYRLGGAHIRA